MVSLFLVILILCVPVLFIGSIMLTSKSENFGKLFITHILLFLSYFGAWYFWGHYALGTDPYGLGSLFSIIFLILGHNIIGFIHALVVWTKMKKIKNEDIIDA